MAKPNAITVLAGKLVQALQELRTRTPDAYPPTRAALERLADPQSPPADFAQAFQKKPFAAAMILALKSEPSAPVALAEDAERLAASPALLELALGLLGTPQKPLHSVSAVAKKLDKRLQAAFAAATERRVAADDLPPGVVAVAVRGKPHLGFERLLPPAAALARRLLRTLRVLKEDGEYPPTLARLARRADDAAPAELVRQAAADKAFKPFVVLALANSLEAPVALAADAGRLAASPLLLELVLTATRTAGNQAVPLGDLAKKVENALRQPFADALARRVAAGTLPPGVGCLRVKLKPHLFLLRDLGVAPPQAAPAPKAEPPPDFARLFADAFDRLDREKGSSNFVSLVPLRRAVPVDPADFDAGLDRLRRAGLYTLSGAEGRHGISAEERAAGIREEGTLLLYVSRRTP